MFEEVKWTQHMNYVKVMCPSAHHEDKWEKGSVAHFVSDFRTLSRASG